MRLPVLLSLAMLCAGAVSGQTPHLTGNVEVSVKQGIIRASWDVSNLPPITNYSIWLNAGFNINRFSDSTGTNRLYEKKSYNADQSEEAMQYSFDADKGTARVLPGRFRVSYAGAFPVYPDTTSMADRGDDSGRIAFNGKTLRAGDQSCWYPVIYDANRDDILTDVTYDITVNCTDCPGIYINGDVPKSGPVARLISSKPVPLFLLAGQLASVQQRGSYFINTGLNNRTAAIADGWMERIKQFYVRKLNLSYEKSVYAVGATPVSRKDAWMVCRFPTIAVVGHQLSWQGLVDGKNGILADSMQFVQFIGHEMGHYYFGNRLRPNSDLKYTFMEGCTEYMALQLVREVLGEPYYRQKLAAYHRRIGDRRDFKSLAVKTLSEPLRELQHYVYVPLVLTALEQEIGTAQVWKWLSAVLTSPPGKTDYAFLRDSLLKSGVSETAYQAFEQRYVMAGKAVANVLAATKP